MSFNVLPFAGREVAQSELPAAPACDAQPADVVDLASRREPAGPIPGHVLDEIGVAAARWQELFDANREIRFDADPAAGGIVASLREAEGGGVVRVLPLREVIGFDGDGPQSAA